MLKESETIKKEITYLLGEKVDIRELPEFELLQSLFEYSYSSFIKVCVDLSHKQKWHLVCGLLCLLDFLSDLLLDLFLLLFLDHLFGTILSLSEYFLYLFSFLAR